MVFFFFSSRRRHTRCALVTGVQTCALPISTVRKADALLERARQTDGAILAIHVFDAAGRIVHSTAEPAPAAISAETLAVRRASEGVAWHRETSEGFLSSIDIASRTGQSAGGILIVYPKAGSLIQVRAMAAELTLASSEGRRGGKEWFSTGSTRWTP